MTGRRGMTWCFMAMIFTAFLSGCSGPAYDPATVKQNMDIITNNIKLVERQNPELHKMWVNRTVWTVLDSSNKEKAARAMAEWSAFVSRGSTWVEIYDNASGRMLAEYSLSSGFTVK